MNNGSEREHYNMRIRFEGQAPSMHNLVTVPIFFYHSCIYHQKLVHSIWMLAYIPSISIGFYGYVFVMNKTYVETNFIETLNF